MKLDIKNLLYADERNRIQYSQFVFPQSDFFIVKNHKSEAIALSENYALCIGYNNPINFLGVDDYGSKAPTVSLAHEFIQEDQYVLDIGESTTHLIVTNIFGFNANTFLYHKQQYGSNLVCNAWNTIDGIVLSLIHQQLKRIHTNERKKFTAKFTLIDRYPRLSERESQVLYFLMLGNSSSQIGCYLRLSGRTVQHYIVSVKQKYLCNSTQQLVEYSLFHTLNKKIPSSLLYLKQI